MLCRNFFLSGMGILVLCLSQQNAHAQNKTDTLKEVRVQARPAGPNDEKAKQMAPGMQVQTMSQMALQAYRMQSVGNMIGQLTPVFVKAYSFNGLATLNFRGSSAAQSQVLWNGIPIQNASFGIADISELPVMLTDNVSIVYGSNSALWGSGNVGGALLIENNAPVFDSGRRHCGINLGAGSFGQYSGGVSALASGRRWYVSAKATGQTAKNDFTFTDAIGSHEKTSNGALKSGAVMLDGAYKTGSNSMLTMSAWYQQYDREIPPTLFETYSVKKQNDRALRLLLGWDKKKGDKQEWYAKAALTQDNVRYDDTVTGMHTSSTAWQYYQEAGWRSHWREGGQMMLFVPVQIAWVAGSGIQNTKYQSRAALAGAYEKKMLNEKLDIAGNARLENIAGNTVVLPGADASYRLAHQLKLRINVQRSYRQPSLSELYYYPGGNADLKPEQGWNEDCGYSLDISFGRFRLQHELAVFNREIHDWIIWLGGAIWTPHNIAEVHSRGVETENKLEYRAGKWNFYVSANTAYTLATTVNSYEENDGSIGKQLPYTPRYNGQANIGLRRGRLLLQYSHTYTGYRFTVADESEYLAPYQTGNLFAMYVLPLKQNTYTFTAMLNNIWNEQYSVVGYRPMPGRNFLISAGAQF